MYRCDMCGAVFDCPLVREGSDHRPDCFRERFKEVSCPYCGGPYFNWIEEDSPVVRCRECKWWQEDDDIGYCDNPDGLDNYAKPDDFCSYGERKDGAE